MCLPEASHSFDLWPFCRSLCKKKKNPVVRLLLLLFLLPTLDWIFCRCFQVGKDTVQTTEDQIMKRDMPPAFIK